MEAQAIRKDQYVNFGLDLREDKDNTAVTSDLDLSKRDMEHKTSDGAGGRDGSVKDDVAKGHVLQIWRDFLLQTSLHGCRHVGDCQRPWITRCVWAIITAAMAVGLGYGLLRLTLRYLEFPFSTEWGLRRDPHILYPAITLCLPSLIDSGRYNASPELLRLISGVATGAAGDVPEEFDMPYSEFDAMAGFRTEDIFLELVVSRYEHIPKQDLLRKRLGQGGSCWTLNEMVEAGGSGEIKATEFDQIWMLINIPDVRAGNMVYLNGAQLFVHPPEVPFWQEKHVNIPPGVSATVTFSKTEISFLPLPYESFSKHGCVDIDTHFKNPLRQWPAYSFAGCVYEKAVEFSSAVCNCVPLNDLPYSDYPECTLEASSACLWRNMALYFAENINEMSGQEESVCPNTCATSIYDVQVTSGLFLPLDVDENSWIWNHTGVRSKMATRGQNLTAIVIQPRNTVVTTLKHVPEMTLLTLLGTVGGYLGLFLGASLLTATELLEALLLSAWRLSRRLACAC